MVVAGTLKLHRVVAISMAPTSTSTMKSDSQKAKELGGSSRHDIALILAISLSKLKTHVVKKKRDIQ